MSLASFLIGVIQGLGTRWGLFKYWWVTTKLVLTEQGAYYDDPDMATYAPEGQNASRRKGTEHLMDQLVAVVTR